MADLYTQIEELWEVSKEMKLEHVKYLSFSGGEKDFLVSDRMVSADNVNCPLIIIHEQFLDNPFAVVVHSRCRDPS